MADALRGGLRPGDSVSRYGGEEFLVILPDTSAEGALAVAERLRERVMALEIVHETNPIGSVLTISLGVMTWDSPLSVCSIQSVADIAAELISSSDAALYRAKQQGAIAWSAPDYATALARVVRAIAVLARVNSAMIHAMVHGVPSLSVANSSDEIIPLPYCNAPISAEAEPATFGAASSAVAVEVAAIIPFIENSMNTATTISSRPPICQRAAIANTIAAAPATNSDIFSSVSSG